MRAAVEMGVEARIDAAGIAFKDLGLVFGAERQRVDIAAGVVEVMTRLRMERGPQPQLTFAFSVLRGQWRCRRSPAIDKAHAVASDAKAEMIAGALEAARAPLSAMLVGMGLRVPAR